VTSGQASTRGQPAPGPASLPSGTTPPAQIVVGVVFGVRSGLRHPRQLTAHTIASETFSTVAYVLLAARAVQRRRPRIAAGRALSAGSLGPAPGGIG
jgi:hypothetical protein